MTYTIITAQRELPEVQIKINGKIVKGKVTGRLNDYATVTTYESIKVASGHFVNFEFSWQAIVISLNTGKPLTI